MIKRAPDDVLEELAKGDLQAMCMALGLDLEMGLLVKILAKECFESRRRGTTGTVDTPAPSRLPVNCDEAFYAVASGFSVNGWTPERDGKGRMTQVHLVLELDQVVPGLRAVVRLKSATGADMLIKLLHEYRCEVWPEHRGLIVKGR